MTSLRAFGCTVLLSAVGYGCSSGDSPAPSPNADGGVDVTTDDDTSSKDALDAKDAGSDTLVTPRDGNLGARCESDADCHAPWTCFSENATGLAQGVCSTTCTKDDECGALHPDALCGFSFFRPGEPKKTICFEPCRAGPASTALQEPLDPKKCHGRPEQACLSTSSGFGCRHVCNLDADCTGGRHCAPDRQLCVKTATDWSSIGTESLDCTGYLLGVGSATICTSVCTRGTGPACGWAGPSTRVERVCTHRTGTLAGAFGAGDLGDCLAACDCDDDCPGPDLACKPLDVADAKVAGRKGWCVVAKRGAMACSGDAGASDAGDAGPSDAALDTSSDATTDAGADAPG